VHGAACAGESVPSSVMRKLDRAARLAELADVSPSKKAKRLRRQSRNLLVQAGNAAARASVGGSAKLTAGCAAAIRGAANATP